MSSLFYYWQQKVVPVLKHHNIKPYGGVEVKVHIFLTLAHVRMGGPQTRLEVVMR
jgi:hypothetical protein